MREHLEIETIRYKSLEKVNLVRRKITNCFKLKLKVNLMNQTFEIGFEIVKCDKQFIVTLLRLRQILT